MTYNKTDLEKDLRNSMQELYVKIGLKHGDLLSTQMSLHDALEVQDYDKVRRCMADMTNTINQIDTWKAESAGCARLGKKIASHMNNQLEVIE